MAPTSERRSVVLVVGGPEDAVSDLRRCLDPGRFEVRRHDDGTARTADVVVVVDFDQAPITDPARATAPVLALTRRNVPEEAERALRAGALDVLPIPFIAGEVAARVANALRLATAEGDLAARNAELAAWAARAGHDLTTPLAIIGGMAETLEAAWDRHSETDRARFLASIRNQARRATAMLDELLAMASKGPDSPASGDGGH